jgi:hypothetical protein
MAVVIRHFQQGLRRDTPQKVTISGQLTAIGQPAKAREASCLKRDSVLIAALLQHGGSPRLRLYRCSNHCEVNLCADRF